MRLSTHIAEGRRRVAGRSLVLLLCVMIALACVVSSAADPDSTDAGEAAEASIEKPLRTLLDELRARHLLPLEKRAARDVLLESLLATFRTGGNVVQSEEDEGADAAVVDWVRMLQGRFAYIDIDRVGVGLTESLSDIRERESLSREDGGIILDLRRAGGNAMDDVGGAVALLSGWDHPLVGLVDGGTRGAAEVLADRLREDLGCVLIGRATRGLPYPLRSVDLGDGVAVMLPDVPEDADPQPLTPDVILDSPEGRTDQTVDRTSDGMAGRGIQAGHRDEYVRKAVDLLTAICAFRQKHF